MYRFRELRITDTDLSNVSQVDLETVEKDEKYQRNYSTAHFDVSLQLIFQLVSN